MSSQNQHQIDQQYVLMPTEVELYVQALQPIPIEQVGSKKYFSFNKINLIL
jgi:hypothetical protein